MSPAYWALGEGGTVIDPTSDVQVNSIGIGGMAVGGPMASGDGAFIGAGGVIDISRTAAQHAFRINVTGDLGTASNPRFVITGSGEHRWSAGTLGGAYDVYMERPAADTLRIDATYIILAGSAIVSDAIAIGGATAAGPAPAGDGVYVSSGGVIDITRTTATGHAFRTGVTADAGGATNMRFTLTAAGEARWGDGVNPWDANLRRLAAGALQITDNLIVGDSVKADRIGIGQVANTYALSFVPDTAPTGGIDLGGDVSLYRSAAGELGLVGALSAAPGEAVSVFGPTAIGTNPQNLLLLDTTPAGGRAIAINDGGGVRVVQMTGVYTITGTPNAVSFLGINVNPTLTLGATGIGDDLQEVRGIQSQLVIGMTTGVSNYGNVAGSTMHTQAYRASVVLNPSPAGAGSPPSPALGASTATLQGFVYGFRTLPAVIGTGWTVTGGYFAHKIEAPSGGGAAGIVGAIDIDDFANFPTPSAPTGVASAGSGLTAGNYRYKITFVNAVGESIGGTEVSGIAVSGGNLQITLSAIPIGPSGTTARKIYRTQSGGATGTERLVATIADNTTTTYVDSTTDATIVAAATVPTTGSFTVPVGIRSAGANQLRHAGPGVFGASAAPSNASVGLEVQSTTKALLLPRLTTTQRDALTPLDGMSVYNSTTGRVEEREDGKWPEAVPTTGFVPLGNHWSGTIAGSAVGTVGTATPAVIGTTYLTVVEVYRKQRFTGVAILAGAGTVATDLWKCWLLDSTGAVVSQTAQLIAGLTANDYGAGMPWQTGGVDTPITLRPGRYYVAFQTDGGLLAIRAFGGATLLGVKVLASNTHTGGTFGVLPTITLPTTAGIGPCGYLY